MIKVKGKYSEAFVYTNQLETKAQEQIKTLCDQVYTQMSQIRIMPDVHAGVGCTIGTTMTIQDSVVPNLVGVDIGCGMETIRIADQTIDLEKLDQVIYDRIPSGMSVRQTLHRNVEQLDLKKLKAYDTINEERTLLSLGTLGGGNHFIECAKNEKGEIYLVIHSGSRHLGASIAEYYQKEAIRYQQDLISEKINSFILELKAQGRSQEIQKELYALDISKLEETPKPLAPLTGQLFADYMHDMKIVQAYALLNRQTMMSEIVEGMGFAVVEQFTTVHNYIDMDQMILRKGAVSARKGEKLLIPMNMRDGSLICIGKGNPSWNYSAPHGAGRLMSRMKAKETFSMDAFKESMEGIYTTSVNLNTLDECPMAYKDMQTILEQITPTVDVIEIIRPIYNFKSSY